MQVRIHEMHPTFYQNQSLGQWKSQTRQNQNRKAESFRSLESQLDHEAIVLEGLDPVVVAAEAEAVPEAVAESLLTDTLGPGPP
jgi:hypothetical protein